MRIKEVLWIERFVTKIRKKHNVTNEEVEEALHSDALFHRVSARDMTDKERKYYHAKKT